MGTITHKIGSGGGRDYSDLITWGAALPSNISANGNAFIAELYNDSEVTYSGTSTYFTLSGITTDAVNNVTIRPAVNHNWNKTDVQSIYDTTKGVCFRLIDHRSTVLDIRIQYTTIQNLQFNGGRTHTHILTADNSVIKNCMMDGATRPVYLRCPSTIFNCMVMSENSVFSLHGIQVESASCKILNNTICKPSDVALPQGKTGTYGVYIPYGPYNNLIVSNNAIFNYAVPIQSIGTNCVMEYNATDNVSILGTNSLTNVTYSTQFRSTTYATRDYRLANTGSSLQNAGTSNNTTGLVTTDIFGTTRPQGSAYDIGAYELIQAAGGLPYNLIVNYSLGRAMFTNS